MLDRKEEWSYTITYPVEDHVEEYPDEYWPKPTMDNISVKASKR